MQLPVLRRLGDVSARARGMPEIKSYGKLFFHKNRWRLVVYRSPHPASRLLELSVVWEIIGPQPWRRTEHLVAVHVNPVSMTRHGFFFIRRHDCSAPGWQTQDQPSVGCDTCDATADRTTAASRGICGRTPGGAGAFGFGGNRFLCDLRTRLAASSWRWFGVCLS